MRARVTVKPANGESYVVEVGNTATIGRSTENLISFPESKQVSRQHAIIRCHNSFQYQIMDLGSRNGTFVNGRRVIMPVTLDHGAVIRITGNELSFEQIEDQAAGTMSDVTIAGGTDLEIEGSSKVAMMVCDIRGFSTMSEMLPEDQVAKTLGQWFREAGNRIQNSGGAVDKFIGDAILAYWIQDSEDQPVAKTALGIAGELVQLSNTLQWPSPLSRPLKIAVALHYGQVTCGNIGLVAQRDATIIGDAVNTVFRIESVMKPLGKIVVLSDDFMAQLGSPSGFEELGEHQLKGKNQSVKLFAPPLD